MLFRYSLFITLENGITKETGSKLGFFVLPRRLLKLITQYFILYFEKWIYNQEK